MATVHREPNQVKWIGVRPGHNGEQIIKNALANNATVEIYEVPADKLLFIFGYFVSITAVVNVAGYLEIYTAVPALESTLYVAGARAGYSISVVHSFGNVPIEVAAGYFIKVRSSAAAPVDAGFNGILIDA